MILAEDNLAERRAVLERRLVDIYKRGPLYTFQVLFAAESFGDLLSRYKYLYLTSRQDRALVDGRRAALRNRVVSERNNILNVRDQLDRTREEREAEYSKYSDLARARERRLQSLQQSARSTERRLIVLQKDEARLNGLLARSSARAARSRPGRARGARGGARIDHHRRSRQAGLAGRGHDRLPVRPGHAAQRRDHPLERHRHRGRRSARR